MEPSMYRDIHKLEVPVDLLRVDTYDAICKAYSNGVRRNTMGFFGALASIRGRRAFGSFIVGAINKPSEEIDNG